MDSLKTPQTQLLRMLITERLTAAAEEIFGAVERTMAEYELEAYKSHLEIERQRKLLDFVLKPETKLQQADPQQLTFNVCPEEVPPTQDPCEQERSPSLGLEDPEPLLQIKEEQWTSPEEDQFEELEMETDPRETMLNRTSCVKSEYDQVQPESGEGCRLSQPTSESMSQTRGGGFVAAEEHSDAVLRENGEAQMGSETQKAMTTLTNNECVMPASLNATLCDISFSHMGSLLSHVDVRKHICGICGKNFTRSTGLRDHIRVHTGEKPYRCAICGRQFSQASSLKRHRTIHMGDKSLKYKVWGKGVIQNPHLKIHMRTHSGESRCQCNVCGKQFSQSFILKQHMMMTHSEDKPSKFKDFGREVI